MSDSNNTNKKSSQYYSHRHPQPYDTSQKTYMGTRKDANKSQPAVKYKRKEMTYVPKSIDPGKRAASPKTDNIEQELPKPKDEEVKKEVGVYKPDENGIIRLDASLEPMNSCSINFAESLTMDDLEALLTGKVTKSEAKTPVAESVTTAKKIKKNKKGSSKYSHSQILELYKDQEFSTVETLFDEEVYSNTKEILVKERSLKAESEVQFNKPRNEFHSSYTPSHPKRPPQGIRNNEDDHRTNYYKPRRDSYNEVPSWFDDPTLEMKFGDELDDDGLSLEPKIPQQPQNILFAKDLEKEKERFRSEKQLKKENSTTPNNNNTFNRNAPRQDNESMKAAIEDLSDIDKLIEELSKNSHSEMDIKLEEKFMHDKRQKQAKNEQPLDEIDMLFMNSPPKPVLAKAPEETKTIAPIMKKECDEEEDDPLWGEDSIEEIKKSEKTWDFSLSQDKVVLKDGSNTEKPHNKIKLASTKTNSQSNIWSNDPIYSINNSNDKNEVDDKEKSFDLDLLLKQSEEHHKQLQSYGSGKLSQENGPKDDDELFNVIGQATHQPPPTLPKHPPPIVRMGSENYNPFSAGVDCNENERIWYYKDPQNSLQGPFTGEEMFSWFKQGYFEDNLLIAFGEESVFVALGQFMRTVMKNYANTRDIVQEMDPYSEYNNGSQQYPQHPLGDPSLIGHHDPHLQGFMMHPPPSSFIDPNYAAMYSTNPIELMYMQQQRHYQATKKQQETKLDEKSPKDENKNELHFDSNNINLLLESLQQQSPAESLPKTNIQEARSLEDIEKQSLSSKSPLNETTPKSAGMAMLDNNGPMTPQQRQAYLMTKAIQNDFYPTSAPAPLVQQQQYYPGYGNMMSYGQIAPMQPGYCVDPNAYYYMAMQTATQAAAQAAAAGNPMSSESFYQNLNAIYAAQMGKFYPQQTQQQKQQSPTQASSNESASFSPTSNKPKTVASSTTGASTTNTTSSPPKKPVMNPSAAYYAQQQQQQMMMMNALMQGGYGAPAMYDPSFYFGAVAGSSQTGQGSYIEKATAGLRKMSANMKQGSEGEMSGSISPMSGTNKKK